MYTELWQRNLNNKLREIERKKGGRGITFTIQMMSATYTFTFLQAKEVLQTIKSEEPKEISYGKTLVHPDKTHRLGRANHHYFQSFHYWKHMGLRKDQLQTFESWVAC